MLSRIMEYINNQPKENNILQSGGLFGFGKDGFTKSIEHTKSSESKLINTYSKMDKSVKEYHNAYENHLKNLSKLDEYANFDGMENLFKKVIMKENFKNGKVDKSLPLLFRNYLIMKDTTPSNFRKEHILRQVNYVLEKYFAGREHMFIKYMNISELGRDKFYLTVTTIENIKKTRSIPHNGYVISVSNTKKELKDILATTKKNLKRKSRLVEFNSRYSNDNDNDSHESHHTRTKSRSRSKTKTKSRTRTKLHSRSHSRKSHTKTISVRANNINNIRTSATIGTHKRKESTKKEKLDIYLTPSQRAQKATMQAIPAATKLAPPVMGTIPAFAPPLGGIEERKAEVLGQPLINFQQPIAAAPVAVAAPAVAATNDSEIWKKCRSYQTPEICNNDPQCFFHNPSNTCRKTNRPKGGAGVFAAPPNFAAPAPMQVQAPIALAPTETIQI